MSDRIKRKLEQTTVRTSSVPAKCSKTSESISVGSDTIQKMKMYTQRLAHIFGDPLLSKTGLEGGQLDSALLLMIDIVKQALLPKFSRPAQIALLGKIITKLEQCYNYCAMINADSRGQTNFALPKISRDIFELNAEDWLVIPGGWQSYKIGHAMLYIVTAENVGQEKKYSLVVINSGDGIYYHPKIPTPNEIKIGYFKLINIKQENLVDSVALTALLQLQIEPSDFYAAAHIYEIILPMLQGNLVEIVLPNGAELEPQLAGTCFWQCVTMLMRYKFLTQEDLYRQMKLSWEYWFLQQMLTMYEQITFAELKVIGETNLHLAVFACRIFSKDVLELRYFTIPELSEIYLLLNKLQNKITAFKRQLYASRHISIKPAIITDLPWQLSGNISLFNSQAKVLPHNFFWQPYCQFNPQQLAADCDNIVQFCYAVDKSDNYQRNKINAIIKNFLYRLPVPIAELGKNFWLAVPQCQYEVITHNLLELMKFYFYGQMSLLGPDKPRLNPIEYAARLVPIFSVFSLVDFMLRNVPQLDFIRKYHIPLTSLFANINIFDLTAELVLESAIEVRQFSAVLSYFKTLIPTTKIFNFSPDVEKLLTIEISDDPKQAEIELLRQILIATDKMTAFSQLFINWPNYESYAIAIIDEKRQWLPEILHDWREIGLLARFFLTSLTKLDHSTPHQAFTFKCCRVVDEQKIFINLLLPVAIKTEEFRFDKFAPCLGVSNVSDLGVCWLLDTPAIRLVQNQFITNPLPKGTRVDKELFNRLAGIRAAPNLQILSAIDTFIDNITYLETNDFTVLLRKAFFQLGETELYGSLLMLEIQRDCNFKQKIEGFFRKLDDYFSVHSIRLSSYLMLIRFMLHVEGFLLINNQLLSEEYLRTANYLYNKLLNILVDTKDQTLQINIHAHMLLLYCYVPYCTTTMEQNVDIGKKVLEHWAHIKRLTFFGENLSTAIMKQIVEILVTLETKIILVLEQQLLRNVILNGVLKIFLNRDIPENPEWQCNEKNLFIKGNFTINIFEGHVYYCNYPLNRIPTEIISHVDYCNLYKEQQLTVNIEREAENIAVFKVIETPRKYLTLYRNTVLQLPSLDKAIPFTSAPVELQEKITKLCGQLPEEFLTYVSVNLEQFYFFADANEIWLRTEKTLYRFDFSTGYLLIFQLRFYGQSYGEALVYCHNAEHAYFPWQHFQVITHPVGFSYAVRLELLQANQLAAATDLLIQEELEFGGTKCWAQYLPAWRLDGLLPDYFINGFQHWLFCCVSPDSDFMNMDDKVDLENSGVGEQQEIYILTSERECCFILQFNKQEKKLFRMNNFGQITAQFIDLLHYQPQGPIFEFIDLLYQIETPSFVLAWDVNGSIIIELPRLRLSFALEDACLSCLQFAGYKLIKDPKIELLAGFVHYLCLQNGQGEQILLIPTAEFLKNKHVDIDPLTTVIAIDYKQINHPAYLSYGVQEDLQQLKAQSLTGNLFLVILYFALKNYQSSWYHMQQCYKDQLFSIEEWQLFTRFFRSLKADQHPDAHACRLKYTTLFLDYFLLLDKRNDEHDLEPLEQQQLLDFKNIFIKLSVDYMQYLRKWNEVDSLLRLTQAEEIQWLIALKNWSKLTTLLNNRMLCLQRPNADISLGTPQVQINQSLLDVFSRAETVFNWQQRFWSLGYNEVNLLGFHGKQRNTIQNCFLTLYQQLLDQRQSFNGLLLQLRCLVFYTEFWGQEEQFLLNLIIRVAHIVKTNIRSLARLPASITINKNYSFVLVPKLLAISNADRDLAGWFQQMISYVLAASVPHSILLVTDILTFVNSREVFLKPNRIQPNTLCCASTEAKTEKLPITIIATEVFAIEPILVQLWQQPLQNIFAKYFTISKQSLKRTPFPLMIKHGENTEFQRKCQHTACSRELHDHFVQGYDRYLNIPVIRYEGLSNQQLIANFSGDLIIYRKTLLAMTANFKAGILGLARKNPVNTRLRTVAEMETGLIQKFMQFASRTQVLTLAKVITLFANGDQNEYLQANPFLTREDLQNLIHYTVAYLLTSLTIKQVNHILDLIPNIKEQNYSFLQLIGKECHAKRLYDISKCPNYLIFEYLTGFLLWEEQLAFLRNMQRPEKSQIKQLIMGGGKTTVIAPLLGLQLANSSNLVIYTVPTALIAMFRNILKVRFNHILQRRVYNFSIKRTSKINADILHYYKRKLSMARIEQGMLTITPDVPNCLLLKWLELSQNFYSCQITKGFSSNMLTTLKDLEELLCQFIHHGLQILDEADLILTPSKSELNFTIGTAKSLEPGECRWTLPEYLLEILFNNKKLEGLLEEGVKTKQLKRFKAKNDYAFGRLEITSVDFYNYKIKRALANLLLDFFVETDLYIKQERWLFFGYLMADIAIFSSEKRVLLRKIELEPILTSRYCVKQHMLAELISRNTKLITINGEDYFSMENVTMYYSTLHPLIVEISMVCLDEYKKQNKERAIQLILLKEWLTKYLPHILVNKGFRVHYGPYFVVHEERGNYTEHRFPERKLAIPYVSKDKPSLRSEFQHPDVVIGFTCLQYFYEGITLIEFAELIRFLQSNYEQEKTVIFTRRKIVKLFEEWQNSYGLSLTIAEVLRIDVSNQIELKKYHNLFGCAIPIVKYYLNHWVFPPFLKTYQKKLTSNAQDLAAMLFRVTKGFSGTTHNYMSFPDPLERQLQQESDGQMLYVLSQPENNKVVLVTYENNEDILTKINAEHPQIFIDAGALITSMSTFEVAKFLLKRASSRIQGVLFIDDTDRLVVLQQDFSVVALSECGIASTDLIKYIDHAHTTGTDIPQDITEHGIITIGLDMTLRDYFQGAKRLRKLGQGQTIESWFPEHFIRQIYEINGLISGAEISSNHIMRWLFVNTMQHVTQEIYIATIQKFHWVIRRRAFLLLLGVVEVENLKELQLTDEQQMTIWENLHDEKFLDQYNRARRQITELSGGILANLPLAVKNKLIRILNDSYRSKSKEPTAKLKECFAVFTDSLDFSIEAILPIDIQQNTEDILRQYLGKVREKFDNLLLSSDHARLTMIQRDACRLLPTKTTTKDHLAIEADKEVEYQVQQVAEKQTEQIQQQQQQHRQQLFQYAGFKPCDFVSWALPELGLGQVERFVVPYQHICRIAGQKLRLCEIREVFAFPFDQHILATENFLRTECITVDMTNFLKRVDYFLEIQRNDETVWILLTLLEADQVRLILLSRPKFQVPIGLRNISGELICASAGFNKRDMPDTIRQLLKLLNGEVNEDDLSEQGKKLLKKIAIGMGRAVL